ncbi:MAG: hypothetical protein ACJ8AT_24455 [Hyalangium sp.]|uniref:hypothetical protein n=1 Tax=Hyalangium sp. TaxID=2028555 RepID=UPI00389A49A5
MPRQVIEYRCLIISPGDMNAARGAVRSAITDWNAHFGVPKGIRLEAVGWDSHAHPETGGEPQALINKQIVDDCDFGVALFGARLGSPTSAAASGSAEEIDKLAARGAPVLIYTSTERMELTNIDVAQLGALRGFLDQMKKKALIGSFGSPEDLRRLVSMHLTTVVERILAQAAPVPMAASNVLAPDIRVSVSAGMPIGPVDPRLKAIPNIKVENHSTSQFFFKHYHYELDSGEILTPVADALTGEPVAAKSIAPGDSVDYSMSAQVAIDRAKDRRIKRAVVVDKIGRRFFSSEEDVRLALANARTIIDSQTKRSK